MKSKNLILIAVLIICLALVRNTQAVSPPPDGGYPGGNTAEGQGTLFSLTTGTFNTAVGLFSLRSNTEGSFNTAIGAGALLLNIGGQTAEDGNENTATGAGALLNNTTGGFNTANGAFALFSNTEGGTNTATGHQALFNNTTGSSNTATGHEALLSNTTGRFNTADGAGALFLNSAGEGNTATGFEALFLNGIGFNNTAIGINALLRNTNGNANTAVGQHALLNNTIGTDNVALGAGAGFNATAGNGNVYIGAGMQGVAGESNACYIASIFGKASPNGVPVLINSQNKLGTGTSSKRFKEDIQPMDKASEALFSLKPVTFRYKKEIDPQGTAQFGLVAEEVEKLNPDLVVHDPDGKPYTVRYEQINAMLLNEFLKEHRSVQEQGATIADLKKEIASLITTVKAQAAQIQKVSAQIEMNRPAPQQVALKTP